MGKAAFVRDLSLIRKKLDAAQEAAASGPDVGSYMTPDTEKKYLQSKNGGDLGNRVQV